MLQHAHVQEAHRRVALQHQPLPLLHGTPPAEPSVCCSVLGEQREGQLAGPRALWSCLTVEWSSLLVVLFRGNLSSDLFPCPSNGGQTKVGAQRL